MLTDNVCYAKSAFDFDEEHLAEGEWNGRIGLRPAPIGALGLMVARGKRADEARVPVACIIAAMGNDAVAWRYWIRCVTDDVVD